MKDNFTGLVLAGGQSKRMGRDKALLAWQDGHSLLSWAVERLCAVCENVFILSAQESHAHPQATRLEDRAPGIGPLGGILTGIAEGKTEWYLVLAVDMPYVDVATLEILTRQAYPRLDGCEAVIFEDEQGYQPLCGLYHRDALFAMEEAARKQNYKMQDLLKQLKVKTLVPPENHPHLFSNWNRMEDIPLVKVKVKLFASFREKLGFAEKELEASDTDSLRQWLEKQLPDAAKVNYRIALNQHLIQQNEILKAGDEIALMPPFAGG